MDESYRLSHPRTTSSPRTEGLNVLEVYAFKMIYYTKEDTLTKHRYSFLVVSVRPYVYDTSDDPSQ